MRRDVPGLEGEGGAAGWGLSDEAAGVGGVGQNARMKDVNFPDR